jgi:four helix bundle protein
MGNGDLKIRTKDYALSVIRLFAELPKKTETQIMGRQLLRSGTSVGAQYREATRAKIEPGFYQQDRRIVTAIGGKRILILTFG